MTAELPPLIQALLDPKAYPDHPDSVDFVQTHISYVFLAGRWVYKLKKPVDFGFLNYTTPELRRLSCEDEVRLNRRLSPDVYAGVLPVTNESGRVRMGGSSTPLDWAVQMRRLPAERMLETMIAGGDVPEDAGRRLGEVVARFHLGAERSGRITETGGRGAAAGNWRENFVQTRPFRGRTIAPEDDDRINAYVDSFLAGEAPLLAERDAGGFIRDLHGDLRSAQIWILEQAPERPQKLSDAERRLLDELGPVRILDCIEFNERLRFCDTASDIAFLAADLAYRRRPDLARDLLNRYLEVTGDSRLPLLLGFYSCYRAYVRGKVDSMGLTEREIDARQRRRLAARARGFFRLAARYAVPSRPQRLVLMMGISGSGKSYLGRLLALRLSAAIFPSDVTRKQLLGLPPTQSAGEAAYTADVTARTYAALVEQAEAELRRGHSVVLDATFLSADLRRPAIELAKRLGVPLKLVWCQATPDLIGRRLRERERDAFRVSDAGESVARSQVEMLEPPRELPATSVIRTSTAGDIGRLLPRLERRLLQ
jgi:aminoglycoside phosphotransferase family enzyme/predicted kinase